MGIIDEILNDTKKVEAHTTRAADEAQKAYEALVKDTKTSSEERTKAEAGGKDSNVDNKDGADNAGMDVLSALRNLEYHLSDVDMARQGGGYNLSSQFKFLNSKVSSEKLQSICLLSNLIDPKISAL